MARKKMKPLQFDYGDAKEVVNSILIPIAQIDPSLRNPNVMTDQQYQLLKLAIGRKGFKQPILVAPRGDRFKLADGHHRVRACTELGYTHISAVVTTMTDVEIEELQLGMNRNRGELDLKTGAEIIRDLVVDVGVSMEELTMTGFTEVEMQTMLRALEGPDPTLDPGGAVSELSGPDAGPAKAFVLEVQFQTAEDLAKARRRLKMAAGKGGDLARGLFVLMGEVDL